jgi:hypothetical protein
LCALGCSLSVPDFGGTTFVCTVDDDCPSDRSCRAGVCRAGDPGDGGSADAPFPGADAPPGDAAGIDSVPGECTPPQTESRGCRCTGTETRTCQSGDVWGPWEGCVGGGACDVGQTRNEPSECPEGCGGYRPQMCDGSCDWVNTGPCVFPACALDQICVSNDCCFGASHYCNPTSNGMGGSLGDADCCSGDCNEGVSLCF